MAPSAREVAVAPDGRVAPGLVDGAREVRGARVVAGSAAGRVVSDRLAAVAVEVVDVDEEASDWRDGLGFAGDGRVALAAGALRTVVAFFFSSPDVSDERSGSASDVVLDVEDKAVRLATAAAVAVGGRVGGLFRLVPTALVRDVELDGAFVAPVAVRVVLVDDAAGRRAPPAVVALVVVGRRGGTVSFDPEGGALEAILRRTDDVGVEGAGSFFGWGLAVGKLSDALLSPEPWFGTGVSIGRSSSGACADQCTYQYTSSIKWGRNNNLAAVCSAEKVLAVAAGKLPSRLPSSCAATCGDARIRVLP